MLNCFTAGGLEAIINANDKKFMSGIYGGEGELYVGMPVMTNGYTHRRGGNYMMTIVVGEGGLGNLLPQEDICEGTVRIAEIGSRVTIKCEECNHRLTI